MKYITRLANKLTLKYAELPEMEEVTLPRPPKLPMEFRDTQLPLPPKVPQDLANMSEQELSGFQERDGQQTMAPNVRKNKDTLPSPQLPVQPVHKHTSTIKDLAKQLKHNPDKELTLTPDQVDAVLWVSTLL